MARGVISGIKNRWWKAWGVSGGGGGGWGVEFHCGGVLKHQWPCSLRESLSEGDRKNKTERRTRRGESWEVQQKVVWLECLTKQLQIHATRLQTHKPTRFNDKHTVQYHSVLKGTHCFVFCVDFIFVAAFNLFFCCFCFLPRKTAFAFCLLFFVLR